MNKKKRLALLLAYVVSATAVVPSITFALDFNDTENHWAKNQIHRWSDLGIIEGFEGAFNPNSFITRADFAVIIDRIMQYQIVSENTFTDLSNKYYTESVLKANSAEVVQGYNNTIRPEDYVTREEAVIILARAFNVTESAITPSFEDSHSISNWAINTVGAMQKLGYINGTEKNEFLPKSFITRAEVVKILDELATGFYNTAGTYSENITGNVIISEEDIKLENMHIDGDLIIAEGVAEGDLHFDNVAITGNVYIKGGGPSSIYFNDTTVRGIVEVKKVNGQIRTVVSGESYIEKLVLKSGAIIETTDIIKGGINHVSILEDVLDNQEITLQGIFNVIENNKEDIKVNIDGFVKELILNVASVILGEVAIDKITLADTIKATVNGVSVSNGESIKIESLASNSGSNGNGSSGNVSTQKYTVTFEGNGAATTPQAIRVESGKRITLPTTPVKDGYNFTGWYMNEVLTELFDETTPIKRNITLYAGWEKESQTTTPQSITVTFEGNGAATTPDMITVLVGETIKLPTNPIREGYSFVGWYIDPELGLLFDEKKSLTEDTVLYAKWILIK